MKKPQLPEPPFNLPKRGERYRHHKGGLYVVTGVARDENDPRIFRILYNSVENPAPIDWSRPFSQWFENVPGAHRDTVLRYRLELEDEVIDAAPEEVALEEAAVLHAYDPRFPELVLRVAALEKLHSTRDLNAAMLEAARIPTPSWRGDLCSGHTRGGRPQQAVASRKRCCDRAGEYNGFGSDGPLKFSCPNDCSCHD